MKIPKRQRLRWRTGTIAETLAVVDKVEEKERSFCYFPDGHKQAVRVMMNRDTGWPVYNDDGTARILAPWLLADIFSV